MAESVLTQGFEPPPSAPIERELRENGDYLASEALGRAAEVALILGQPLLLTGEPGTGKTTFARALADRRFGGRFLEMQVKSGSGREDLLYRIDELARFRDAQPGARSRPLIDYLELRPFGEGIVRSCPPDTPLLQRSGRPFRPDDPLLDEVFGADRRPIPTVRDLLPEADGWEEPERWVVLIDEIDKAPRDTPNDLLEEFERMGFAIPELGLRVTPPQAAARPVVIITSNSEKSLPDAFLRRCAFHHIEFPNDAELRKIIASRLAGIAIDGRQLDHLLELFNDLRAAMQRKPGTAELLYWLRLLDHDDDLPLATTREAMAPAIRHTFGAIAKQRSDIGAAENALSSWAKRKR